MPTGWANELTNHSIQYNWEKKIHQESDCAFLEASWFIIATNNDWEINLISKGNDSPI